jgi:MFS family permease
VRALGPDQRRADAGVWRDSRFVRYWLATTISGTGTNGAAGMALAGLAAPLFNVHAATLRLRATPRDRLGRVTAFVKLCSQGTVAAGAAVGGVLAGLVGARVALFLFGAVSLAVTVILLPAPVRRARLRRQARPTRNHGRTSTTDRKRRHEEGTSGRSG